VIQAMLAEGTAPDERIERFFYPAANAGDVLTALKEFSPTDQQRLIGRLVEVATLDEVFAKLGAPWTSAGCGATMPWGVPVAAAIRQRLGSSAAMAWMYGAAVVVAWERVLLPYVRDFPSALGAAVLALCCGVVFAPVPWVVGRLGRRGARLVVDGLLVPGVVATLAFVVLRVVAQWALRLDAWHGPLCSLPHDVNDVWNDGPWLALFFGLCGGLPMARLGALADRIEHGTDTAPLLSATARRSVGRTIKETPRVFRSVVVGAGGGALMVAQTFAILDRCDTHGGAWSPFFRAHLVARGVLWPLLGVLLVAWLARGLGALRDAVEHIPRTLRRTRPAPDE
jgi:hypothetical protein